jgi:hypothetical protein
MWVGSNDPTTAAFRVTSSGKLYGTGVVITGDSSFSGTISVGSALSSGGTIGDVKLTASQAAEIANSASSTASAASASAQQAATDARTAKEANAATDAIARAALPSTSFDGDAIAAKINSPTTTTTIDGGRLTTGTIRSNAVVSDFISAFYISADKISAGTIGATISITTPNITVGSDTDSYYFKTNSIRTGTSRAALGLNNVNMISANSAGMLSNWYPYNNDDVSLGLVSPYVQRFKNVFLVNNPNVSSDIRLKKEISTTNLGLDFINSLNPVQYKLKARSRKNKIDENGNTIFYPGTDKAIPELDENDPGNRYHYGFIAQEVKSALDLNGVGEQAGLWAIDNLEEPDSTQALVYSEFISPLTKAVQELSDMVESLQIEVNTLKGI